MRNILKELKPYWKIVILIIFSHMVRAYGNLILPDYTSKLIDTGITNQGFEYAAPLAISDETYNNLEGMLLDEEKAAIKDNYYRDNQGNVWIKKDVWKDKNKMQELSDELLHPISLYQMAENMTDEQRDEFIHGQELSVSKIEGEDPKSWRPEIDKELDDIGESFLNNAAISLVTQEYTACGGDINEYQKNYLSRTAWIMLAYTLMTVAAGFAVHFFASRTAATVGYNLRDRVFSKVLSFSQGDINDFSTASLITRTTNDVQQIQFVTAILLRVTIFSPTMALGAMYRLYKMKSPLMWIIWVAVIAVVLLLIVLLRLTQKHFKKLQSLVDKVNLAAREILTGLSVIRAFGRQDVENKRFNDANTELKDTNLYVNRVMAFMNPVMMLIMNGTSLLIVWYASKYISDGIMQVGQMTAAINYILRIVNSFLTISMISIQLPRAAVSANRVADVLETEPSIKDPEEPVVISEPKGVVEFENVDFSFDDAEEKTLENISFTAKPGETTAIIGSTGSGKSTIINLIMRYYDVTSGSIKFDGVDIRDMSMEQVSDMIGLVSQEAILFSGTIESNIAYGADINDKENIQTAAKVAHAEEFIENTPKKYKARVAQGGANLSGGQKQRLSIARAIAKKPNIFLFDDSFSALDFKTDASLRKALGEHVGDVTTIIVAQRVSTILNADSIIVLDEGKIVGEGTHQELLETCQVYKEIAESQLSKEELYGEDAITNQNGGLVNESE